MNRLRFLGVNALALSAVWISQSRAQTTQVQNPPGFSETESLGEIVVTAQKREESLATVPISVAAYSQETMDQDDIKSLSDIATITPGLNCRDFGGLNSITIRGISQNSGGGTTSTGSNTTAIYIDDAPIQ